jgi:hypothetical protein
MNSLIDSAGQVLVAAHDAGGAELVSAWVKQHPGREYRFVLDGPARAIFAGKLGAGITWRNEAPDTWVAWADVVLTATSYASELETRVRRQARAAGKPAIACLDHWTNYRRRFAADGGYLWPDEFWLADETAWLIARETFPPESRLVLAGNAYVRELREAVARLGLAPAGPSRVLFVSEPLSRANRLMHGDARFGGYDEFDALRLLLGWARQELADGRAREVRLRPHPSEEAGKYAALFAEFADLRVTLSDRTSLQEDCAWAGLVCGCSSMALFVAHAVFHRPILCAIPVPGVACLLPIPGIAYLRDQVAAIPEPAASLCHE